MVQITLRRSEIMIKPRYSPSSSSSQLSVQPHSGHPGNLEHLLQRHFFFGIFYSLKWMTTICTLIYNLMVFPWIINSPYKMITRALKVTLFPQKTLAHLSAPLAFRHLCQLRLYHYLQEKHPFSLFPHSQSISCPGYVCCRRGLQPC